MTAEDRRQVEQILLKIVGLQYQFKADKGETEEAKGKIWKPVERVTELSAFLKHIVNSCEPTLRGKRNALADGRTL
jgi:hypothetical protein